MPQKSTVCDGCGKPSKTWRCGSCLDQMAKDAKDAAIDVHAELVKDARRQGVDLWVEDGRLKFKGTPSDELRGRLKAEREALIRYLGDEVPF